MESSFVLLLYIFRLPNKLTPPTLRSTGLYTFTYLTIFIQLEYRKRKEGKRRKGYAEGGIEIL